MGRAPFLQVGEEKEQPTGNQEGEMRAQAASDNSLVQPVISHLPALAVPVSLILLKALSKPFELSPELVWVQSQSQFTA